MVYASEVSVAHPYQKSGKLLPGVLYFFLSHTYQSLSCETAINTEFSELFSPKRMYVKYKNAILLHIGCSFAHEKIRYMGIYFLRNFITTTETRTHCRSN